MKQGAGAAVAMFAGVLAVTGGLGWLLYEAGGTDETATAPTKPRAEPPRRHDPPPPDPSEMGGPIPPHLRVKPVPPDGAPRIPIEGHDDLKLRNWKDVAAAFEDMRSVSHDMMEKGPPRPDDPERMESMQKRMQHFMQSSITRPPGLGADKRFTQVDHPAFAVNMVASVLERSNLPLTEAQTQRLAALATQRGPLIDAADDDLQKDDPTQWMLNRVAARASAADAFYAEMFATLTPAQAQAVTPQEMRGRMRLDLASSAATWGRIARPILFTDEKQLVDMLTTGLSNQFNATDRVEDVRAIVDAWVRQGGFDAADLLDLKGFTRSSHVPAAVPRMIDLLTRVIDALKPPDELVESTRRGSQAYVPLRK